MSVEHSYVPNIVHTSAFKLSFYGNPHIYDIGTWTLRVLIANIWRSF